MSARSLTRPTASSPRWKKRPDFLHKKTDLENQKISIKVTRNGLYPQVDLIASFNYNGLQQKFSQMDTMIGEGQFYDSFIGVQISVPLDGNRAAKAAHAIAQYTAAQLLRDLKRTELTIVTTIRNDVAGVETNAKQVDTTRVARELRQERLDAAEKQLEVGRITSFEVVTAQEDLATAQGNEITAIINYVVSLATLSHDMATILDELGLEVEEAPILR